MPSPDLGCKPSRSESGSEWAPTPKRARHPHLLLREEGDQDAVTPPGHRRPHAAAPVHVPSHGRRSFSLDGSSTLIRLCRPLSTAVPVQQNTLQYSRTMG
ncbi:hypothetical protein ScPMuIL_013033 [Solemya velum]